MLYHLLYWIEQVYHPPGFGVVKYLTFRAAMAAITALFISFIIGGKVITRLKEKGIVTTYREGSPEKHKLKAGTPMMGGIIVIAAILIPTLLWGDLTNTYVQMIIFVTAGLGVVGFMDDYLKIVRKKKEGLIGWYKIIGQVTVGLVLGLVLSTMPELTSIKANTVTTVPFFKNLEFDFGIMYIPLVIFIITATSNAVNLTDGLDGLAIGTSGIVAMTLGIIVYISGNTEFSSYLNIIYLRGNGELVVFCIALVGAALGFLWYNSYPAQVFMGDTGSLALGGAIGALTVMAKKELILPILGGIFFMETVSVIVQRLYFKYTKKKYGEGRRVFKMAPLHHHFELLGWAEPKIVTRFYILAILMMILSLTTFKVR
ncbi:MAG: phospho-N-acetylmuramoyl-pentapeptide-transferase [Bacteroidota bacterium]